MPNEQPFTNPIDILSSYETNESSPLDIDAVEAMLWGQTPEDDFLAITNLVQACSSTRVWI